MDTFTMLFRRFRIAACFMSLILLLRNESFPCGNILLQLRGMGALGHVGQSFSYWSAIKYASAGVVYGILMMVNEAHFRATTMGGLGIVGIGLIATVIPVVAFLAGLERIGPTHAAMLSTLEPVATVLLAGLLFGEHLAAMTILGGALILVAVIVLT